MSAPEPVVPAATDERIREMVRRGRNLERHGRISGREVIAAQMAEIWLIAAEDRVVSRETADINGEIARFFGGAS